MTRITTIYGHNDEEKYVEIRRYDSNRDVTTDVANKVHEYLKGNKSYENSDIVLNRDIRKNTVTFIGIGEPDDLTGVAESLSVINNYRIDD